MKYLIYLISFGLLLIIPQVSFAKSDPYTVPRWEMECRGPASRYGEYCAPMDCHAWCAGKKPGWVCESGIFKGKIDPLLACCNCPTKTIRTSFCYTNSDCPSSYICRLPQPSKAAPRLKREQPDYRRPLGTCVPVSRSRPPAPELKDCFNDKQCGPNGLCRNRKCIPH